MFSFLIFKHTLKYILPVLQHIPVSLTMLAVLYSYSINSAESLPQQSTVQVAECSCQNLRGSLQQQDSLTSFFSNIADQSSDNTMPRCPEIPSFSCNIDVTDTRNIKNKSFNIHISLGEEEKCTCHYEYLNFVDHEVKQKEISLHLKNNDYPLLILTPMPIDQPLSAKFNNNIECNINIVNLLVENTSLGMSIADYTNARLLSRCNGHPDNYVVRSQNLGDNRFDILNDHLQKNHLSEFASAACLQEINKQMGQIRAMLAANNPDFESIEKQISAIQLGIKKNSRNPCYKYALQTADADSRKILYLHMQGFGQEADAALRVFRGEQERRIFAIEEGLRARILGNHKFLSPYSARAVGLSGIDPWNPRPDQHFYAASTWNQFSAEGKALIAILHQIMTNYLKMKKQHCKDEHLEMSVDSI
ncbi:MAG: hypothetical protein HQK53_08590 [Oligoflexia bacterium]|nr:hypothetical protein [Oligoflexia bacterium]